MLSIGPRDSAELAAPLWAQQLACAPTGTAHRTRWARILALAALAALVVGRALPGVLGAADRLAGPLPAQVVSVLDGDTLEVWVHIWLGQDLNTRVRLAGIDAPELKDKCDRERILARRSGLPPGPARSGCRGRDGSAARNPLWEVCRARAGTGRNSGRDGPGPGAPHRRPGAAL